MARQARTTLCFGLVLLISLVSKALAQGWPYRRYCPCICSELSSPELTYALGPGMFKQVDCQYRNLNDVPSSFPPDTQVLLLNNNNILNITDNIDYLYDLKYLDVSHNFLSAIYRDDIAANRRLQFINAGWNQISYISRLSFKTMSKLKHLLLSTNNLLYIPQAVYGLTTLAVLDLSKNKILGVFSDSLQGLDRLQFLLLENNNIGTVQLGAFFQTPQLVNLNLDGNRITYLPPQIFNGLTSLEVLKLNDNLLQGVTSGVFNILYNIQTLDLHGNRVTSLDRATFHGLSLLQNLDLKENEIRSLPMTLFQGLVSLQTLDISENPNIGTLPYGLFAGLYNLQTITLSHVTRVPQNLFTGLTKLQSIRMSDSRLPLITPSYFMDLSQLQVLELPNNCIEILQPSSFSRLRILATLDLSDNLIKSVDNTPFSGTRFPSLTRLHLQNNRIGEIQAGAFANLPSLQELRLDNNSIPLIPAGLFSHGTKLRSITLDNNQIHTIDGGVIPTITNVDRLTVVNNYLSCDCQLFEFAQWFQQHWQSVERANDVYCYAPEVYKNRRLIDLITTNKNPFICVHPRITTEPKIANVTKVVGENVYLHCHITPKAVATLTWTLPSLLEIDAPSFPPLMNHTTRALANHYGTLVLYDIQKNNSGIYKCTSSNTIGSDFIIYNVVVNDRPPPTLTPPTTKAPRPGTTHAGVPGTTHAGVPGTTHAGVPGTTHAGVPGTTHAGVPGTTHAGVPANTTIPPVVTSKVPSGPTQPGGATTIRPGHNGTDSPCHPNPCMNDGVCSDILKEHSEENSSVLSQESTEFGQDPLMYVVRCTCHKNYGGSLCQYRKPETPREITVIRSTKNYITLTWKGAEMQHVQGYRVLYSIVGERTVIKSVPIHPTVQTYTMEELDMDVSYRICVVAFNEGGESLLGSSNCIWAETQKAAERKNSIFNMQLVAIGGGCLAVVIGLFLIGYVYQKLKERQQDKEEFGEPSSMQQAGRTGSVSEVLRRNVRRPMTSTSSFYSNSDDVMLIDIQGYPERQMYMNPMDSRQGMLRGDLDRTHGFREFIPGEPDLFPKAANKRKTLKIQDTSM